MLGQSNRAQGDCKTCYYWQRMGAQEEGCHFLIIENQMRGCPPENCKRWKPKNKQKLAAQQRASQTVVHKRRTKA